MFANVKKTKQKRARGVSKCTYIPCKSRTCEPKVRWMEKESVSALRIDNSNVFFRGVNVSAQETYRRNLFVQRHRFVIKTSSSSHGGHLNLERLDRLEKCCSSANEGKKKEAQRKRLHGDFCVGVWVLEGGSVLLYYVKNLPVPS